jgi:hypothetical protein
MVRGLADAEKAERKSRRTLIIISLNMYPGKWRAEEFEHY